MSRYFFKILVGEWKTKLRIPQLFVSSFSLAPKTAILINASSKNIWKVDIEEEEEEDPAELYFKKGWPEFVKDNSLVAADFLIFKFDGNSTFKVVICGKSACDKVLEIQERAHMKPKEHKQSGDNKNRASTGDCGENRKGKNPILVDIKEERVDSDPYDETWDEEKEQEEEEEEESDKFGDISYEPPDSIMTIGEESSSAFIPSFRIQLQLASAKKGVMCIPTRFFKKYMIKKKHKVEMETSEGVWKVTSLPHLKRGQMFARFSRGWSEFARRNWFQAGETLLFRMIRRGHRPKFIVCKE